MEALSIFPSAGLSNSFFDLPYMIYIIISSLVDLKGAQEQGLTPPPRVGPTWHVLLKDAVGQVCLKLVRRVWRRRFSNENLKCIIAVLSSFDNDLHKDARCRVWLKLAWPFGSGEDENVERVTDRRSTDNRRLKKAYVSFRLRWAKISSASDAFTLHMDLVTDRSSISIN